MNMVNRYAYEAEEEIRPVREERQQNAASPLPMVLVGITAALLVLLALGGLIYIKYSVVAVQMEINTVNQQIQAKEGEILRLEAKIQSQSNLMRIRERAEELGMGYPEENSIEHISLKETVSNPLAQTQMQSDQ